MSKEGEEACGKDHPDGRSRKLSSDGAAREGKRLGRRTYSGGQDDLFWT